MKIQAIVAIMFMAGLTSIGAPDVRGEEAGDKVAVGPRIAWYGTLDAGLAEAKRSGRPILLVSGAPQCLGVPGVW